MWLPDVWYQVWCVLDLFHFWWSCFCAGHSLTAQMTSRPGGNQTCSIYAQHLISNLLKQLSGRLWFLMSTHWQVWRLTFTVSNDAPSRITTSLRSAIRSCRLRRCLAGLGSYSSKCSRPRFFPLAAAMMPPVELAHRVCVITAVRVHKPVWLVCSSEAHAYNTYNRVHTDPNIIWYKAHFNI